jgi:opacity protein-like surface antigen
MRLVVRHICAAIFASLATLPALAADLVSRQRQALNSWNEGNGWYLRGDIGYVDYVPPKEDTSKKLAGSPLVGLKFDNAFSIGGGIGYKFDRLLRFDLTGDYMSDTKFIDRSSRTNFAQGFNTETGKFGAAVTLANAYIDIGSWYRLTPYVGGGVGFASHGFNRFFSETTCTTVACGNPAVVHTIGLQGDKISRPDKMDITLAWALMAGVSIDLGRGFSLDTGYRYLNMGPARSGRDAYGFDTRLKSAEAHEVRVGLRWALAGSQFAHTN